MKKMIAASLVLFVLAVPTAFAQTGIGVGIGWDNGYSIRVPFEQFSLQFTGTFDSVIPEDDNLDTETDVEIAAYGLYPILEGNDVSLNLFGGFGLLPSTRETTLAGRTYDRELGFLIRFGFEPEAMITDTIGISGKAGLGIDFDQGYDGLDDSGKTNIGGWGSIGVHWYFQ